MDYLIEYYKEKETDPMEFLKHFRRTTKPIGGGTESADNGELADWDAVVVAIDIAKKQMIDKAVEWLEPVLKNYAGYNCGGDLVKNFEKYMEEK